MTDRKVFNKRHPTAEDKHFIPLPEHAKHYIHHPKMSADKLFLYALIIDYYNPTEGYAFPSVETLAVHYNKAPDTTSKHLDVLKEVGLIDFPDKGYYLPLVPLDAEAFYGKFPEAWGKYKEGQERLEIRRNASAERMRQWRRRKGYT